jgi:hypothetical protein
MTSGFFSSMSWGFTVSSLVCFVSLLTLIILALFIWLGLFGQISLKVFHRTRMGLAIFAVVYAAYSAARLIYNVMPERSLPEEFVPELIAYSVFWVLGPPAWFLSRVLCGGEQLHQGF